MTTSSIKFNLTDDQVKAIENMKTSPIGDWKFNVIDQTITDDKTLRLVFSTMFNNDFTWHFEMHHDNDFDQAEIVSESSNTFNIDNVTSINSTYTGEATTQLVEFVLV